MWRGHQRKAIGEVIAWSAVELHPRAFEPLDSPSFSQTSVANDEGSPSGGVLAFPASSAIKKCNHIGPFNARKKD